MNQFQSIGEVLSAIKRRLPVIVLVTFVGCLLSLWFSLSMSTTYQATAVVQIEEASVSQQVIGASAPQSDASRKVRLIEQRLMARDNLVEIMERNALFLDNPDATINERVFSMRQAARIEEIVDTAQVFSGGAGAPSGLRIHVFLDDPQKAADVANELMALVIDQSRNRAEGQARDTLQFFVEEEARITAEINRMEGLIAEYKRDNSEQLPSGVLDLRTQLSNIRDTELTLDREMLALENTTTRIREDDKQAQLAALAEQKSLIQLRKEELQQLIVGAPEVERELNILQRELTQYQDQYSVITRRKAEAEVGQQLENRKQTDRFEVLETALPPDYAVSRSRSKTAVMGAIAAGFVGLFVGFVLEMANPAIRSAAQMERALGIQPVVAIPMIETKGESRRRGLTIVAIVLGAIAAMVGLVRFLTTRPDLPEFIGRFLPMTSRG